MPHQQLESGLNIPLFEIHAGEAAISVACDNCGMTGTQRVTYNHHVPTDLGKSFGFQSTTELIKVPVSWARSHLGCPGNDVF